MLPCFDDPCIKSTFTITIQIPSNLTGLSNMPTENTQIIGDEKKIKFYTTPPMCTYLLCISIGDFQCIEGKSKSGIPIKLYAIKDELGKFNNKLIYLSPQLSMKNMNVDKEICELCSQFDDKQ